MQQLTILNDNFNFSIFIFLLRVDSKSKVDHKDSKVGRRTIWITEIIINSHLLCLTAQVSDLKDENYTEFTQSKLNFKS